MFTQFLPWQTLEMVSLKLTGFQLAFVVEDRTVLVDGKVFTNANPPYVFTVLKTAVISHGH